MRAGSAIPQGLNRHFTSHSRHPNDQMQFDIAEDPDEEISSPAGRNRNRDTFGQVPEINVENADTYGSEKDQQIPHLNVHRLNVE